MAATIEQERSAIETYEPLLTNGDWANVGISTAGSSPVVASVGGRALAGSARFGFELTCDNEFTADHVRKIANRYEVSHGHAIPVPEDRHDSYAGFICSALELLLDDKKSFERALHHIVPRIHGPLTVIARYGDTLYAARDRQGKGSLYHGLDGAERHVVGSTLRVMHALGVDDPRLLEPGRIAVISGSNGELRGGGQQSTPLS